MQLISGSSIKEALKTVKPAYIAVAYVGSDWGEYVDKSQLKEIVVSPTFGSNPFAINELVHLLGWDNVHFLDQLHAKVYIGDTCAAVGSFNLTANGLSATATGLEEAGFLIENQKAIEDLHALYQRFKSLANVQYLSQIDKKNKLLELQLAWNKGVSEGVIFNRSKKNRLSDYQPLSAEDFYICWYRGKLTYKEDVYEDTLTDVDPNIKSSVIEKHLSFLEDDKIEKNKWILCWPAKADGSPHRTLKVYWHYIHEIVSNLGAEPPYTKVAIERNDKSLPPYPFEVDKLESDMLRVVLNSGRFPEFLEKSGANWSINDTFARFSEFVSTMSAAVKENTSIEKQVQLKELLESRIVSPNRLRRVNPILLALAQITLSTADYRQAGKVATWAAHLILARSGDPLEFGPGENDPSIGKANEAWILRRMKGARDSTLQLLTSISKDKSFSPSVRYWAKELISNPPSI